jgi:hypothetical protein
MFIMLYLMLIMLKLLDFVYAYHKKTTQIPTKYIKPRAIFNLFLHSPKYRNFSLS